MPRIAFQYKPKNLSASENCLSYLVNRMLCDVTPEAEIKLKLKVYSFGLDWGNLPKTGDFPHSQ